MDEVITLVDEGPVALLLLFQLSYGAIRGAGHHQQLFHPFFRALLLSLDSTDTEKTKTHKPHHH